MDPFLVLSTNELESNVIRKLKKYQEVVKSVLMDAVVRPFSGKRTPKSCMLTSVARVPQTQQKREINQETKGWWVKGKCTPFSVSDGDDDEQSNDKMILDIGSRGPF